MFIKFISYKNFLYFFVFFAQTCNPLIKDMVLRFVCNHIDSLYV